MTSPSNASLANVRVGGRNYPAAGSQRCATCVHPARRRVEERLAAGDAPAAIAADLPQHEALTSRQISDHFRAHLPVQAEGVARFHERMAVERGEVVEKAAESVVTALTFAQRVLVTVDARLAAGSVVPGIRDGLRAAEVLAATEATVAGDYSHEDVLIAFMGYTRAIKRHCTAQQMRGISEDLAADPVLRDLMARARQRQPI